MQNLMGFLFSLLLVFICFVVAYPVSRKNPEVARKIVHIGAAHWYFIYVPNNIGFVHTYLVFSIYILYYCIMQTSSIIFIFSNTSCIY